MTIGNQSFQKQANIALVLKTIHENELISRVKLSRILGLKKSSVTNIINELIEVGIVLQKDEGEAGITGGRKPVDLALNAGAACIVGIELEKGYYRSVICDLNGQIIGSKTGNLPEFPLDQGFSFIMEELEPEIKKTGSPAAGIGVGISGTVDIENEVITRSFVHSLSNYSIKDNIKTDIPVFFDNDTNCGAWGELWCRRTEAANFLYLLARFHNHNLNSAGIPNAGMGIVINNEVYYGSSFNAGEFDTNQLNRLMNKNGGKTVTAEFLAHMFEKLSVSFKLLDPQRIILAGDLQYHKDLITEALSTINTDSGFGEFSEYEKISFSETGEMEIAYGAAALVLHRLYMIPQLGKPSGKKGIWWSDIFSRLRGNGSYDN